MPTYDIITSCSSTRTTNPIVRVADLPSGLTMQQALDLWLQMLETHKDKSMTPGELYRGLGFFTLAKIQERFKPKTVHIITGGQGFTDINEQIVPYDFTAHPKEEHNIHQKVTAEPFVQSVWWRMINDARGKTPNPVGTLVTNTSADFIVISCNKIFLRYIAEDILSVPFNFRNKIKILLAASSVGSVPAQLRPMIIPFERDFINHLPGNRNDGNHRAMLQYLTLMDEPEFASKDVSSQISEITSDIANGGERVDVEEYLKQHPELLQMGMEEAYKRARRELGAFGGRTIFKSAHRKLSGHQVTFDDDEIEAGIEALQGLSFMTDTNRIVDDEEDVVAALAVFAKALKKQAPRALVSGADIVKWAETYFKTVNESIPNMMSTPNKLAGILKANASYVGLEETSDGKLYRVAPEKPLE